LVQEGPHEVQSAAAAFNAMQRHIAAHMAERMHILAAISHDLQSPITRMRVRTDLLADEVLREKLQADLLAMQRLVEEGLAYARTAHASTEKQQKVDLPALLDALACDHIDAGRQLTLHPCSPCVIHTRPQALRRIIDNLIDNAMKFAGSAEIAVRCEGRKVDILVSDRGPGIPTDQIAVAMQPFSRLETSRNRDTGGSGLGLAIAQGLSRALGGDLTLLNRPGGGLEAVVSLHRAGAESNVA
jgi:signal transduction histidine kinase